MAIYAIGDLHLSHDQTKPMDVFGPEWSDHVEKMAKAWDETVNDNDLVVVLGDISWAMHLKEAAGDLAWVGSRKGTKLLLKGNHDYWWSAIGRVRAALPDKVFALQNDHFHWQNYTVCGTRGWICPGDEAFDAQEDQKIYLREISRLELSLTSAIRDGAGEIITALHFPPFNRRNEPSGFTELLEKYAVKYCLFGHIHDPGRDYIFQGERGGVTYRFAAADGIGFRPLKIVGS